MTTEGCLSKMDAVQIVGAVAIVISVFLYGNKRLGDRIWAATFGVIGSILWVIWGFLMVEPIAWALMALNAINLITHTINFWRMVMRE